MQKKLIAMAVAGLVSGAAFAQSNVTVYGIADVFYGRATADGAKTTNVINSSGLSGSRIGFKGTEDLGNGLSAIFTLEYGLNVDSAGSVSSWAGSARQQFVGLTGGFGTVVAGGLQTAGYDFAGANNPLAGSVLNPYEKVGASALLSHTQAGRASNAFAYISPDFGGAKIAYNHARVSENVPAVPSSASPGKENYANLLAVSYANGPIGANAIYSKISMASTSASDDVVEWGLGGSYDFKVAKVGAQYQSYDNKAIDSKDNKWGISAAIPAGPAGTVVAEYAKSKIKQDGATTLNNDVKSWTVAYTHGLSKRTTAYAGYNRVTNGSDGAAASTIAPVTLGGKSSTLAFGLRHSF